MPNSSFDNERLSLFINGVLINGPESAVLQSAGNASRRRRVIHSIRGRRVREGPERRVPEPQYAVVPEPCVAEIGYVFPEPCVAEIGYVNIPEPCTAETGYIGMPEPCAAEIDTSTEISEADSVSVDSEDSGRPQRRCSFREAMIREGVLVPIPGSSMLINPVLYDAHMRRMQADAIRAQPSRAQLMLEDIRKNGINSERFNGLTGRTRRDAPES